MVDAGKFKSMRGGESTKAIEGRPSVAVIGAGVAGMSCARFLTDHGYPVSVFEKEKELGGRASIIHDGLGTYDHGCQYFRVRDKKFQDHLKALQDKGVVAIWPAREASCLHGVVHQVEDDSVLYVGVPGMNAIAQYLADGVEVKSDTIVSGIKQGNHCWKLIAGGKRETFEIVVASAPAELTAELLKDFPVIAAEAATVKTRPCLSVSVGFEHMLNVSFDAAHFTSCPIMWASNNRTKPGRAHKEIWTIQATTSWSAEHFSAPEDTIGKILLSSFFEASGLPPVMPKFMRTHRWYYGKPDQPLNKSFLWDKETRIGACGDWCHNGRLEGAFLSGISMAECIIYDCPHTLRARKTLATTR